MRIAHKAEIAAVRADPKANPAEWADEEKRTFGEITDLGVMLELGNKAPNATTAAGGGK